ncbi:MAG: GNAT family N-acetyltransferase [Methylocystaceae bacterium]|nr:GNAT family N-acetyltransferase [Methylocystaceae bacterium]
MNVKSLTRFELPLYETHLMNLPAKDRHLRFSGFVSDESITKYVDSIDLRQGVVKAIYNDALEIIAAVHVVVFNNGHDAEIALSVDPNYRRQGYGHALFEAALKWVRSRSIEKIYSLCLRENRPMVHIANARGMTIHHDSQEAEAYLNVDKPTLATMWEEMLGEQIGWADYTNKRFKVLAGGNINFFDIGLNKRAS